MVNISPSSKLNNVRYEIRGDLAKRAYDLEKSGTQITHLNIGNPASYGLIAPDRLRIAMIENISNCDAYTHQKGIFPAREAIIMQQQSRGIKNGSIDQVIIGNGVSELIDITLRALLENNDEVLIPSPDYPLWTASTILNGGKAIHYPCKKENSYIPDPDEIKKLITNKTRALVLINPNNPTGAVYPKSTLEAICNLCKEFNLLLLSDEIYDRMTYDDAEFTPVATIDHELPIATFSGLSKVYRACGYRVGWVSFTGSLENTSDLLNSMELLAALRLCSNVPGQWAVQTALGGTQSIDQLTAKDGRLYKSRHAVIDAVDKSLNMQMITPQGAMYAFIDVNKPGFDDKEFALKLLEDEHILVAPGTSFNYPNNNAFRITLLPEANILQDCIKRMDNLISSM
jgi:alanine-synthesizing transaminase